MDEVALQAMLQQYPSRVAWEVQAGREGSTRFRLKSFGPRLSGFVDKARRQVKTIRMARSDWRVELRKTVAWS